ncbi:MAG: hypothetical protein ACI4RD_08975 [Kiritimatiellia bacterium]
MSKREVVAGLMSLLLSCAVAEDGFNLVNLWWVNTLDFATDTRYWEDHRLPSEDGVAHYLGLQLNDQIFSSSVTLRGLDFGNVRATEERPRILGGGLVLSGEAFISGSGAGAAGGWGRLGIVASTVRGTGGNVLTKKGCGELLVNVPFADFGVLAAGGGRLLTTNVVGSLFAEGATLACQGGFFRWAPELPAGETAAAAVGKTTYGPFGGALMWGRGTGASATLTLAELARTGNGATLWLAPDGGADSLGDTERLLVAEAPSSVNGILDPGIETRDPSVGLWPFRFTAYDADKGVVAFPTAAMRSLAEAGATDVALVSAATAWEESKRVAALVVDDSLSIGEGVTLAVGDDQAAHPAGVIFNRQSDSDSAFEFKGEGTLDFGASPGVVWATAGSSGEYLDLRTRIQGTGGVTFASRNCATATASPLKAGRFNVYSGVGGWSGPTYVNGTELFLHATDALPDGDIFVLNGSGLEGGEILLSGAFSWSFRQNLHLAGCANGWGNSAVLRTPPAKVTFNGAVTLEDDAAISSYDPNNPATFDFRGGLYGPGELVLPDGATCNLFLPSTISGIRSQGSLKLNVSTNGTLGTGRVWLRGGTGHHVAFDGTDGLAVDNEFRCDAGDLGLSLAFAKVTLNRPGTFASASLSTFSRLALGADVHFNRLDAVCAQDETAGADRIVSDAEAATLSVGGDDGDSTLAVPLSDGAGALSLVKRGTCVVELAPAAHTYSGGTTIEAGTLRLNDDPLLSRSLLYWLDADLEESLTKDADGTVTAWRSRGGREDVTFTAADGQAVWGANQVNGRNVVTTGESGASRLCGDRELRQNTVFIVYRIRAARSYMGLFGSTDLNGGDYGVRLSSSTPGETTDWNSHRSDYNYVTTGWVRRDGGRGGPAGVGDGSVHVLTLVHDRDNWPHSDSWGKNTLAATFVPSIGYYAKSRYFSGDYCEVLAFDRVLTETEMRKVENYLSEKWRAQSVWAEVGTPTFLPETTALRIETDGVLDLAGRSLTVGSLAGNGIVTNSSSVAATLTVTGRADYTGRVGGRTTLELRTSSAVSAVVSAEATLAASAGTLTVGRRPLTPPTDGLAYWCDAARTGTVLCDGAGAVTSWVSRAGSSATALVNDTGVLTGTSTACARPTYSDTALGGKPGVCYEAGCRALWADVKSPVRTVFAVVRLDGTQNRNSGLWGIGGKRVGFRTVSYGTNPTLASWSDCYVRPSVRSDRVAMDGIDYAAAEIPLGEGVTRVFSARLDGDEGEGSAAHFANLGLGREPTCATSVGSFDGNGSIRGAIGEVIAYDWPLSEGEMRHVEAYLLAKWRDSDWVAGDSFATSEDGLTEGGLAVGAGASVDLSGVSQVGAISGGGSVSGDLTLGGLDVCVHEDGSVDRLSVAGTVRLADDAHLHVVYAERLGKNVWHPFLTATSLLGTFASDDLPSEVMLRVSSTEAALLRTKGFVFVIR